VGGQFLSLAFSTCIDYSLGWKGSIVMTNLVGQQLGHYRLTHLLGRGGFADVYLGKQVYLESQAAIKVLSVPIAPEATSGFQSEARILAQLTHPHIIRLLDYGIEEQMPYFVMEYAPGGSLRERYPIGQRLPVSIVVRYVRQIAEALQYAHRAHLTHRDVKPANLLLGKRGHILLSDFGIALRTRSPQSQTTEDFVGTISYMAPEQIQGKSCRASDQYALGVIAYEWLSGKRLFSGSFAEIALQHSQSNPPPPDGVRLGVPDSVIEVVLRALAKRPEQRHPGVLGFAVALERAAMVSRSKPPSPVLTKPQPASDRQWTLEDDLEGRSTW
jgi:eukaryotic-like serine/threonine-protein kinase